MINQRRSPGRRNLLAALFTVLNLSLANLAPIIENLRVEYTKTPFGIDVKTPRFSWQMTAPA